MWPSAAPAQSPTNAKPPTRTVERQILTSTSLPAIRIRFEHPFKYIGTQNFILYERARAEQFFFVDADKGRRIKRMYMLQFEGYLPQVNATYDYPVAETVSLGGQTYIVNAETVPSISAVVNQNPQSDVARAVEFLRSKGYTLSDSVAYNRFVRLVDDAKRNEFIMVYIEAATSAAPPDKAFSARAQKGFVVLNK